MDINQADTTATEANRAAKLGTVNYCGNCGVITGDLSTYLFKQRMPDGSVHEDIVKLCEGCYKRTVNRCKDAGVVFEAKLIAGPTGVPVPEKSPYDADGNFVVPEGAVATPLGVLPMPGDEPQVGAEYKPHKEAHFPTGGVDLVECRPEYNSRLAVDFGGMPYILDQREWLGRMQGIILVPLEYLDSGVAIGFRLYGTTKDGTVCEEIVPNGVEKHTGALLPGQVDVRGLVYLRAGYADNPDYRKTLAATPHAGHKVVDDLIRGLESVLPTTLALHVIAFLEHDVYLGVLRGTKQ